jgi:hypothetical protein
MCVNGKSFVTEHSSLDTVQEEVRVQPEYIGGHQLTTRHGRDAWCLHRGRKLL